MKSKKTLFVLSLAALVLFSLTTLSLTAQETPGALGTQAGRLQKTEQTQQTQKLSFTDAVDVPQLAGVVAKGLKGEGWDFTAIISSLVVTIFAFGGGWLRERLKGKKTRAVLAAAMEGAQTAEAGIRYLGTGEKKDFIDAKKQLNEAVLVSRALWEEIRKEKPGIDNKVVQPD